VCRRRVEQRRIFYPFIEDKHVKLIGVEAAGRA